MVDLHQSLRPTGTVPPPPVAEIAARAGRRRRRRLTVATGAIVVVAAVGLAVTTDALSRSTPSATVADGVSVEPAATGDDPVGEVPASDDPTDPSTPSPSSTTPTMASPSPSSAPSSTLADGRPPSPEDPSPTSAPTTTTAGGSVDDPSPAGPELVASAGLRTTATVTSSWDSGYCLQIDLDNETVGRIAWEVVAGLGGRVDEHWNSTVEAAGGDAVFTGEAGYNVVLEAGASTSFGACIDTTGRDRGQASITGGSAGSADR